MEMHLFGRTIYADKLTGVILHDTGEVRTTMYNYKELVNPWETIKSLSERLPETVNVIELEFGEYSQDFATGILGRVNPETLTLEFSYPDLSDPNPETPPTPQAPLSEQVKVLEAKMDEKDRENKAALFEIYNMITGGE